MSQHYKVLFSTAILMAIFSISLSAQISSTPKREVGLRFNSLNLGSGDGFSAFYKKEIGENKYRRYRFGFGNIGFSQTTNEGENRSNFSLGASIAVGTERRKQLSNKTIFYRGWEWNAGTNFSLRNQENFDYGHHFNVGLGYVLGLQHDINQHFAVNIEAIPGVGLSNTYNRSTRTNSFNVGASVGSTVALSVVYKI
ncbi:MAG: hypothetical protein RIR11_1765 [Bacteroidota bacterium]